MDLANFGVMFRVVYEIDKLLKIITMILDQNKVRIPELFLLNRLFFQIQAYALVLFVLLALNTFHNAANILHDVDNMPENFIAVCIKHIKFSVIYDKEAFDELLFVQKVDLFRIQLHPLGVDVHIQGFLIVAHVFAFFELINGLHLRHVGGPLIDSGVDVVEYLHQLEPAVYI